MPVEVGYTEVLQRSSMHLLRSLLASSMEGKSSRTALAHDVRTPGGTIGSTRANKHLKKGRRRRKARRSFQWRCSWHASLETSGNCHISTAFGWQASIPHARSPSPSRMNKQSTRSLRLHGVSHPYTHSHSLPQLHTTPSRHVPSKHCRDSPPKSPAQSTSNRPHRLDPLHSTIMPPSTPAKHSKPCLGELDTHPSRELPHAAGISRPSARLLIKPSCLTRRRSRTICPGMRVPVFSVAARQIACMPIALSVVGLLRPLDLLVLEKRVHIALSACTHMFERQVVQSLAPSPTIYPSI